jgi:hypothetical protein
MAAESIADRPSRIPRPIDHSTDAAIVSAHVLDALRDHVLSLPAVDGVLSNALICRSDKPKQTPPRHSLIRVRISAAHP